MVRRLPGAWRDRLFRVIFLSDTPAGRRFDVVLIAAIVASVTVVVLESSAPVRAVLGPFLTVAEWIFTGLFLVEYVLRLLCAYRPHRYALSFFGLVDLFTVLPAFLGLLLPGSHYLGVLRVLRVLRVFRVLKLVPYIAEATLIVDALRASRRKITVFLFAVLLIALTLGSLIYVIEGEANGFTSIPRSLYWAVVTLTTVGYGDISPQTGPGQALAMLIMIMGYGMIAVPTGLVTVEVSHALQARDQRRCQACSKASHERDAAFCRHCGTRLDVKTHGTGQ